MHELSTMVRLVKQAAEIAEANHAQSVQKVIVEVGEMTDIVPEYLHKYYPEAAKGTILETAELETHVTPTSVRCLDCENEYHPSRDYNYCCPVCGSKKATVLSGRSVVIHQVIIES